MTLLGWYGRFVSPLYPQTCRFHPSCSRYAREAYRAHGVLRGTLLAVVRLLKCHPLHAGGFDPVPPGRGLEPAAAHGKARQWK